MCILTCTRRAAPLAAPKFNPRSFFALADSEYMRVCENETFTPFAAACEVVAAVAGRPYGGSLKSQALYTGCVWSSTGSFYSNTKPPDAMGTVGGGGQLVCTGAPDF